METPGRTDTNAAALRLTAWIKRISDRDEAALAALYEATVSRVYALALRMTGVPATAEEVVEDVYFQVWSTAASFDPARGNALTWMLVICRSQALMKLRAGDAAISCADPEAFADVCSAGLADHGTDHRERHGTDPHALLAAAQEHSCLHRALQHLDGRERQLLALAFFRGLTYGEIARQMAMPLGTVKSCIRKALLCLRGELERSH